MSKRRPAQGAALTDINEAKDSSLAGRSEFAPSPEWNDPFAPKLVDTVEPAASATASRSDQVPGPDPTSAGEEPAPPPADEDAPTAPAQRSDQATRRGRATSQPPRHLAFKTARQRATERPPKIDWVIAGIAAARV